MKAIKSFVVLSGWLALAVAAVFGKVEGAANVLAFVSGSFALLSPLYLSDRAIADAKPEDAKPVLPGWLSHLMRGAFVGVMVWGGLFWTAAGFSLAIACMAAHRHHVLKRDAGKAATA